MRRVPACWRVVAGAILACAAAPVLLSAAPAAPDKEETAVNPVEKLHKDLDKVISLKIEKQPLSIAMDMLHAQSNITFVLDSVTIQQQLGFTPDQPPTPVDLNAKDMKVRTVLRAILAQYGLSYAPIGDTVVVTTEDVAMVRQMRQRVNVDLSKVELSRALKQLAHDTATNLIVDARADKDAQAQVTMQLEDVPLETAVRLLSEMAGLKPVRVGNVLFVTKKDIANELRNDPDLVQPTQPGQPQPGVPPIGIAVPANPPPTITAPPAAPPGVPPAVDPDKTADTPKPPPDDKKADQPDKEQSKKDGEATSK